MGPSNRIVTFQIQPSSTSMIMGGRVILCECCRLGGKGSKTGSKTNFSPPFSLEWDWPLCARWVSSVFCEDCPKWCTWQRSCQETYPISKKKSQAVHLFQKIKKLKKKKQGEGTTALSEKYSSCLRQLSWCKTNASKTSVNDYIYTYSNLYQWSILEKTWTNYQDSRTTPKNKWSVACISVDCYFNAASFFPSLAYSGCAFLTHVSCICFVFFQIWRFLEQPKLQLQYTKGTLPLLLEAVFKQPKGILFIASPVFNDGQSWSCCVRRHQRKWTGNMKLK